MNMQIIMQSIGQPVSDFSVVASIITIAGTAIDCAAQQMDTVTLLNVVKTSTGAIEINPKKGGYGLAIITIPAKVYQDKPVLDASGAPVLDMQGNPAITREAQPIDPNAIAVTMWPTL